MADPGDLELGSRMSREIRINPAAATTLYDKLALGLIWSVWLGFWGVWVAVAYF
jgi:hypothetical protein